MSLDREKEESVAHILVIDDDPLIRDTLREVLESAGHTVTEAANGKEGVEQYRRSSADLVITNIVMPEMDGLEVTRKLHGVRPELPVIAISGYDPRDRSGYLSLAREYGAGRTLTKPLDREQILEAVQDLLESV